MRQFLTLPILVPIVLGIALLILQPKSRRVRSIYIMAASLATTALSLACICLFYTSLVFALLSFLAVVVVSRLVAARRRKRPEREKTGGNAHDR